MAPLALLILAIRFSLILTKVLLLSYHYAVTKLPDTFCSFTLFLELKALSNLFKLSFLYSPNMGC